MSDLTTYLGNKILRWLAGNAMPTEPTDVYVALYDGDPKGAGTEITLDIDAGGRLPITFDAIASGTDNQLTNSAAVDFGTSDSAESLSHIAIFDASTSGNMLWTKQLAGGPFAITIGMPVKFEIGGLVFNAGD